MVLQAFESPWPLIQANAAYFAGCLLSELSDTRPLAVYLPKVLTFTVTRMGSCSENLVVGSDLPILLLQLGDKCTGKNDGKFCQCCCPSQVSSGSEHAFG
jgi:hypothetical protein